MATDPRGLREDAPLLDAWLRFQEQQPTPFTIPGHKHRTDLVGDVITGVDGNAVEQDLLGAGLPVESADRDVIVAIVTLANTTDDLDALASAIESSIERRRGQARPAANAAIYTVDPITAMVPRQAFFAEREVVAIDRAIGRISTELIAPYPPGIPVLAPGERITTGTIAALSRARDAGVRIAYAADPTLASLVVVAR